MRDLDKLDLNVSNYWSTTKLIFFSFLATIFSLCPEANILVPNTNLCIKLLSCNSRFSYEKIIVTFWRARGREIKNNTIENY